MPRSRDHTCHARNCDVQVPPAMFMCKRHWWALPKKMRNEVWAVYVPGQEDRMDPTEEYLAVATKAVQWLADKEGFNQNTIDYS
jgi:hypothetical protein